MTTYRLLAIALLSGCGHAVLDDPDPQLARLVFESRSAVELSLVTPFDISPEIERIELSLNGERTMFSRDEFQEIAEGIEVWSGKSEQPEGSLYVTKNHGEFLVKLVEGNLEYDINQISGTTYELRTPDLTEDHDEDDGSVADVPLETSSPSGGDPVIQAIAPFTVTINLAYTAAALAKVGSQAKLVSDFSIGLARLNESLKNSRLNVRVVLGRVVKTPYIEPDTLTEARADLDAGLIPGLPIPVGKNKTVVAIHIPVSKFAGTAQLAGKFALIKAGTLSTLLVAHELGHTFNAIHSHGFLFSNGTHTVMIQEGNMLRAPIYSNPNVIWNGQAAGDDKHFNARRICTYLELGSACWIAL